MLLHGILVIIIITSLGTVNDGEAASMDFIFVAAFISARMFEFIMVILVLTINCLFQCI